MNYNSLKISFENKAVARIKSSWTAGTSGRAQIFQADYQVETTGATIDVDYEIFINEYINKFYSKLSAIQADDFRWTRCLLRPNLTSVLVHPAVFSPIHGKVKGSPPSDLEFVVNIIIAQQLQSRNLIIPGVSSSIRRSDNNLASAFKEIEEAFTSTLTIDKVSLTYMRAGESQTFDRVVGTSVVGFRNRRRR